MFFFYLSKLSEDSQKERGSEDRKTKKVGIKRVFNQCNKIKTNRRAYIFRFNLKAQWAAALQNQGINENRTSIKTQSMELLQNIKMKEILENNRRLKGKCMSMVKSQLLLKWIIVMKELSKCSLVILREVLIITKWVTIL